MYIYKTVAGKGALLTNLLSNKTNKNCSQLSVRVSVRRSSSLNRNTIYSAESFHLNLSKYYFIKKTILLEVKLGSGENTVVNFNVPNNTLKFKI